MSSPTSVPSTSSRAGFTLVEMITVIAIMVIMTALVAPNFTKINSARATSKAAFDTAGVLEQARTYAMSKNTYVWVGFYEEDAVASPGTSGTGRVVISVVASKDGTCLYDPADPNPAALDASRLVQLGKLTKLENAHLDTLDATEVSTRNTVPASAYQIGDSSFEKRTYPVAATNQTTFAYPISGTPQYQFVKIVQFNPLGDASKIVDTPTPLIELGIRPAHGNNPDLISKSTALVQLSGIGGRVKVYRP